MRLLTLCLLALSGCVTPAALERRIKTYDAQLTQDLKPLGAKIRLMQIQLDDLLANDPNAQLRTANAIKNKRR